jgi:AcrR family transcriptional regulator
MPRPPKARLLILEAAESIVKVHGAAHLTFDELAKVSGVTRGGITYHFPTKEALLEALVARDVAQWARRLLSHREALGDVPGADVIAQLRSSVESDPERRRLIGGMLSAVAHDPGLLEPVREFMRDIVPVRSVPDGAALRLWILRLAAEGLFWTDMMKCTDLPGELRQRLVIEIETLARQWAEQAQREESVADSPASPGPESDSG